MPEIDLSVCAEGADLIVGFIAIAVVVDKVTVVTGSRAELPCDISSPPLDSLYLVLWYKNDSDFPIFK